MARRVLPQLHPADWQEGQHKFLQQVDDTINRPLLNRVSVSGSNAAVTCNGAIQSSGIGTAQIQPKRYAEFTVKVRVTFNINSVGPAYIYCNRTLGNIPAKGAAANAGDVTVGGDAFAGGTVASGISEAGTLSFLDTGLDVTKQYRYYIAVLGPNANTLNVLISMFVMERS